MMDKSAKWTLVLSLVIAILIIRTESKTGKNVFNVVDYGAVGDGNTNDTQAFERTWNYTCNVKGEKATMIIPYGNTFLVYPLTLAGPCNLNYINIVISGKIVAPKSPEEGWKGRKQQGRWLIIRDVKGLNISGSGLLDGRGNGWWDILCTTHPQLLGCVNLAPTVLSLVECNEVYMGNLTFLNSPQTHILVMGCNHVNFTFLTIDCPGSTPNTDGIHLQNSHRVSIHSTNIGSGDDCISIGDHTSNIYITNVNCGPGHGVSIGSLGRSGNKVLVENITVDGVHFFNTTNGLRIKTWQKGTGHVRGVRYQNIYFTNVKNPIIIDQHYCDVRYGCKATGSGVHISEVRYTRTLGTSLSDYAINLNCSEVVPCTNILLERIELESSTPGVQVNSSCNNAYGNAAGIVQPKSCLLQST